MQIILLYHVTLRLQSLLQYSPNVARITEVPPVGCLPNKVVQWRLLSKLRQQTAGTIMVRVIRGHVNIGIMFQCIVNSI